MNPDKITNINYLWSELMIEELFRNGVKNICIAPGSRSTPLTLAAARHKEIKKTVHFDERGLAYYALGLSSASGEPVALISTSGTAVANFFPALIEASKKKLPLVFITADRPPELRKAGSLQTIDQPGIFGGYVRWAVDLPAPDENIDSEFVLTTVDQALFMSKSPLPGPVHINCMFREPLAPETSSVINEEIKSINKRWLESNIPYTTYFKNRLTPDNIIDEEFAHIINESGFGVVVAGKLKNRSESQAVIRLSEHLNWPLFGDIVSGTRNINGKNSINNWDLLLLNPEILAGKVNTVIHFGGRITSKRWYRFIKNEKPENYITVLNHPLKNDPLNIVTHRIHSSPEIFANIMVEKTEKRDRSETMGRLIDLSMETEKIVNDFIENSSQPDEMFIARTISKLIKSGESLFLGNSMPVRDMDMFYAGGEKDILWGGNRGASGIDGNIASASGFATGSDRRTTLIIGDVAALHDLNSLRLASAAGKGINIIIINNNGGGIFSFLPVADQWGDEGNYFLTPHNLGFRKAAEMFGLDYYRVESKADLKESYERALGIGKSNIIEVITDRDFNVNSHKKLMKKLKDFYKISDGGGSYG